MLKLAQPKNQGAPRTRPPTRTVKMQQRIMKFPKDQGHMPMEKTNRPTIQNRKGRAAIYMAKTHQAIIQDRKDRAQRARQQGWDQVPLKAPAPREPQQVPADTKYRSFLEVCLCGSQTRF